MKKQSKIVLWVVLILTFLLTIGWPFHIRNLSESELQTAQAIFGESVDYEEVRIKNGGFLTWIYPGVTIGNTIAFPKGAYDETEVSDQALFLHEMTHVWQYQNHGLSYIPRALYEEIFTDAYVVHYDAAKTFAEYDVEEQAEIVAEYHLLAKPEYEDYIREIQGN